MSEEGLLEQLLSKWGSERAEGRMVTAQELCAGYPDLLIPLQRRIEAVQRLERLERGIQRAPVDSTLTTSAEPGGIAVADTPTAPPFVAPTLAPTAAPAELDLRGYGLIETLGQGGMGEVYRSCDPSLGRDLAIKVIRADCRHHSTLEHRFLREARITGLLQHPNIVPVYNLGRLPDGRLHYTMRLVRGQTFAQILKDEAGKSERLPALLGIFEKICQAVAYAHSKRVLHRDLKPANVMIGRFGEVQVMDWGLAKLLSSDNGMPTERPPKDDDTVIRAESADTPPEATRLGSALGTPAYMAPEQAAGDWEVVDERADVFALGAILCEILTGAPPYRAADGMELLRRARRGDLADTLARLEQCGADAALTALCRECLASAREDRPRHAGGVAQRVADYQAEVQERLRRAELERVAAEARAREEQARAAAERRARQRTLALAGALLVLLIGGVAGIVVVNREQQRTATERDEKQKALDALEVEQDKTLAALGKAEQQAAIASAVNDFLQKDLLGQADIGQQTVGPSEERDPDVKVRTLLDRASKAIESKLTEQPLTEAAIRLTMANAYRALGRYEDAQRHLERSLQLRTAHLAADHPDALESKQNLAGLRVEQGNYALAEPLFQEVLQARTAKLGADHPDTLNGKHELAILYHYQGKYDLAEPLYKEVLQVRAAKLGADHPDTLTSKNTLAVLFHYQGKYGLAEPLFKEVVQARMAKLGADHPDTLSGKHSLAMLYDSQSKHGLAESLFQEVLQVRTAKLGADHPDTLSSKHELAGVYHQQSKYGAAEPLYKDVLQRWTAKLGAAHPDTLSCKNNLAGMYRDQGRYDLAEPLHKEVLQAMTAKLGADHPSTLTSKNNLAVLYNDQGKYDLAEALYKEVLQARTINLGGDHPDTLTSKYGLAVLYRDRGEYRSAEPLYKDVLQIRTVKLGADHPLTLGTMASLSLNFLRQKKYAEAETILRECLTVRDKKQPDHWTTFDTRSMLGEALAGQKKYAEAEPLSVQGYKGMKQREKSISPKAKARLTESLERLVQLYDAWDKKDKADEYRKLLTEQRAKTQATRK